MQQETAEITWEEWKVVVSTWVSREGLGTCQKEFYWQKVSPK